MGLSLCLAESSVSGIRLQDGSMTRLPLILPWLRDLQQKPNEQKPQKTEGSFHTKWRGSYFHVRETSHLCNKMYTMTHPLQKNKLFYFFMLSLVKHFERMLFHYIH